MRHSSARNVIERIFGVIKRRFRILLLAAEYSIDIQSRIPVTLCVIHNIVSSYNANPDVDDGVEQWDPVVEQEAGSGVGPEDDEDDEDKLDNSEGEQADGSVPQQQTRNQLRDTIAQAMWVDYQVALQNR